MGKDVIVALDFDGRDKTLAFLDLFTEEKPFVKIGMELFYAEGPAIVREVRARGHKIFLDLKLHDIPNTVKKAMAALSALDVDIVNLHAAGTEAMMTAALEGLTRPDGKRPLLIAVTQLTSTDQARMEKELWIERPMEDVVLHYAENAARAGLDGVVCSPLEAERIHKHCGPEFLTVTPGVRFAGGDAGDQKRVATPALAKAIGSDPFIWASGIKSPIYCDNRLILTAPNVRDDVERTIAETVQKEYPQTEALMGTATAGIAHAAIAAHMLGLPMGYVRSDSKDHGRKNQIEGKPVQGEKVVVIEDLISTGGSVLDAVSALRDAGAEVLGIISIFTYGMQKGLDRLAAANVRNVSLTDLDTVVRVGAEEHYITEADVSRLLAFRDNPSDESWITKGGTN